MAKLSKTQRGLHHQSASSIHIGEGFPNVKEGNEGDITLRHIRGKGVYIFVKFRNRWYSRQLLSGQGRSTGVKESNLENPTPGQQLNFYDPKSGQHLPVDVSEVFTLKFGSPGKLTLGSKKAKYNGSVGGNPGLFAVGDDTTNSAWLNLGKGSGGVSTISSGFIDASNVGGAIRLVGGYYLNNTYRHILRIGIPSAEAIKIETEINGGGTDAGGILKLRNIDTGVTVDTDTKFGSLYSQGGADDPKLYFKNNAGTIYDLTTAASGTYLPLAGGALTGDMRITDTTAPQLTLRYDAGNLCRFSIDSNGATTIATTDSDGAEGHLNIEPNGHVEFDGCGVGFELVTATFNATDTDINFKNGNKQILTLTDNLGDLNLTFPATSGNFILLLKQDGTGSRLIHSAGYLAFEHDGTAASGSSTVKFAGGSNPTLTTDANHVDILSFFWDADNQICYGVATLDFQF